MQNITRITEIWSKSKTEVEFQYGVRLKVIISQP